MRSVVVSMLAAALCATPSLAHAWGDEGHRVVGLIAQPLLLPAVRDKVDALLAADTADTLTPPDFVSRTTWADRWRDSDRNTTKVRYMGTREWHFVDTEIAAPDLDAACFGFPALHGTPASAGPAQDCVVDKVEQFAAELADPAQPQAERVLALKFLLHFVGDLHQPLHAADNHDQGGNAVMILVRNLHVAEPLHRYWDVDVVERLGRDPQTVATEIATGLENEAAEWSAGTPRDWARETFGVARDVAYKLPVATEQDAGGTIATRLDLNYELAATEAARQQLGRAGVRLAATLNAALR